MCSGRSCGPLRAGVGRPKGTTMGSARRTMHRRQWTGLLVVLVLVVGLVVAVSGPVAAAATGAGVQEVRVTKTSCRVRRPVVRDGGHVRASAGHDRRLGRPGRFPERADRRPGERASQRGGSRRVRGRLRAPPTRRPVAGQPPRGLRADEPRQHRVAVLPQQRATDQRSVRRPRRRQRVPDAAGLQHHVDRLGPDGADGPQIAARRPTRWRRTPTARRSSGRRSRRSPTTTPPPARTR